MINIDIIKKGVTMKIESSEVQMQVETTNYFEVNVESSLDFKQTLLGIAKADENPETADLKPADENDVAVNQAFSVKNNECDLETFELITKQIIELLLARFLGMDEIMKLHPKNNEQATNTKDKVLEVDEKFVVKNEFKFERTIEYTKKDTMDFSSKAIIKTADKDIEVDLNLSYSKEFYEKHSEKLEFSEVAFLDPLVLNYDGSANALDNIDEEMTFMFDLNGDGQEEELPLLKSGNGFLALDKNGNGQIDDGMELFGPQTNNGFDELRDYDSDGNNWIDENDEIFNDLRIWSKNADGQDELVALGQAGIGALYLSDIASDLTYNTSVNESIAHLKSTSIFLKEDGTAGLLSSMDFIA